MRLRFYKHDVDFVDLELGKDGDEKMLGMGMKFITVSFSIPCHFIGFICQPYTCIY